MEYQNIINLLDNTPNQPFKTRTENQVEVNADSHGTYSQIRFKTLMLRSSLYDYSEAYILVGGTITITRGPDDATEENKRMEKIYNGVIFSNWVLFCE